MTVTTHPPNTSPHVAAGAAQPPGWLARLAGWCYDHRRRVLVLWIGLLVVASVDLGDRRQRLPGPVHGRQRRVRNGPRTCLQAEFRAFAGDTADVVVRSDSAVTSAANEADAQHARRPGDGPARTSRRSGVRSTQGGRRARSRPTGASRTREVQFDQQSVDLPKAAVQAVVDAAEAGAGRAACRSSWGARPSRGRPGDAGHERRSSASPPRSSSCWSPSAR